MADEVMKYCCRFLAFSTILSIFCPNVAVQNNQQCFNGVTPNILIHFSPSFRKERRTANKNFLIRTSRRLKRPVSASSSRTSCRLVFIGAECYAGWTFIQKGSIVHHGTFFLIYVAKTQHKLTPLFLDRKSI